MGLQIVLLSLILEFRRETRSKCPRTSENKNFIPVSQSGFLWWPNIPRCINRIRIVQFIRFAPDLGRICTGPPHIHNLQAIHFSLPSAFSAFSIPKPGSEGCWAAKRKIANYPCVYLFYPWHTSTMSSILNSQLRKLFHFPRKLELLYHSQDEWWRCILVELETNLREV